MKKKFLGIALAGAMALNSTSVLAQGINNGQGLPSNGFHELIISPDAIKADLLEKAELVSKFNKFVKINENGVYVDGTAREIGVSQEVYNNFLKGIALENEAIKNGDIKIVKKADGKFDIELSTVVDITILDKAPNMSSKSKFDTPQEIKLIGQWYGWQLQLTKSETDLFVKALGAGAGVTWLAAELSAAGIVTIPASIPMGIIAAAQGAAAGVIALADQGNGISIYYNTVATPFGWIWPN